MTSYEETNIAKKKNKLELNSNQHHVKLASQLKKGLEFCFSFLWQEHLHSQISGGYACMLASLYYFHKKFTEHFQQNLPFESVNSNTRVGCERCTSLIKKTLARRKSIVVVHVLVLNKFNTLFECFYGFECFFLFFLFFKKQVNGQCIIGSTSMLMFSHIHNAAKRTITRNSYFKKFEVLISRKQQGSIRTD